MPNIQALALAVLDEKIFSCISHYKTMPVNGAPRTGPVWTPRSMVGRIYEEDHYTLLRTKYESSRQEDCLSFPIASLWKLMTPGVGSILTPGVLFSGFM